MDQTNRIEFFIGGESNKLSNVINKNFFDFYLIRNKIGEFKKMALRTMRTLIVVFVVFIEINIKKICRSRKSVKNQSYVRLSPRLKDLVARRVNYFPNRWPMLDARN